jgi:hypothetical protein
LVDFSEFERGFATAIKRNNAGTCVERVFGGEVESQRSEGDSGQEADIIWPRQIVFNLTSPRRRLKLF